MAVVALPFDAAAWTADQVSMAPAMACNVMAGAAITFKSVGRGPTIGSTITVTVTDPSADPTPVVTAAAVLSAYATWKTAHDNAKAAEDAERAAIQTALDAVGGLRNVTLAQANAAVDGIGNLADARVYLKKLNAVVYVLLRRTGSLRPG